MTTDYSLKDRLPEWTSWVGVCLAVLGAAMPHMVPQSEWTGLISQALPALGAALVFIPQTPHVRQGEGVVLAALQLFKADLPPEYATVLGPIAQALATKLMPPPPPPPTNAQ